jgi:uncharacterized protein (TIGR00369 family)
MAGPGEIVPPAAREVTPPAGYHEVGLMDPFEAHVGPFFEKRAPEEGPGFDGLGELWAAFYIDERHVNASGICHGGMLMTFADAVLGTLAWNANDRAPCVTIGMQTNFMRAGRSGDLVEVRPEMVRRTRSILFIQGTFVCQGMALFQSTSLWKVVGK